MANLINNKFTKAGIHLDLPRNVFNYKKCHTTNVLTGKVVPMINEWVLPASSYSLGHALSIRSAPIARPILDKIFIDVCVFWTPYRILCTDTPQWLGENQTEAWTLKQDVKLPHLTEVRTATYKDASNKYIPCSYAYIADHYLGPHIGYRQPEGTFDVTAFGTGSIFKNGISVLPSRAYDMIYNYYWRDENIIDPILFSKGSGADNGLDISNYQVQLGTLHYASRIANMWNKLLPSPQRGDSVTIDLLGFAPVYTRDQNVNIPEFYTGLDTQAKIDAVALKWAYLNGFDLDDPILSDEVGTPLSNVTGTANYLGVHSPQGSGPSITTLGDNPDEIHFSPHEYMATVPTNLWADMSAVSAMSINQLRWSVLMQHYLERSAAAGSRASEFYASFWGLKSTHQDDDLPKLIIQKRYQINVSQVLSQNKSAVVSNNEVEDISNLGDVGAYSLTAIKDKSFADTFTEYGILQYQICIRHDDSFSLGIDRHFTQNGLLDNYLSTFDHIGEVLYEKGEIAGLAPSDGDTFGLGYNRAWSADRYQTDTVVGILAPNEPEEAWTLARRITTDFSLNQNFIEQKFYEFDRALLFPIAHGDSFIDEEGIPYNSDRYQWIVSLCAFGKVAKTMSKDSEPGILRI